MAQWEAPTTHNEIDPADASTSSRSAVSLFRDVDGRYKLWSGALPSDKPRAYFANDPDVDGRIILRDDPVDVRLPFLYSGSRVIL